MRSLFIIALLLAGCASKQANQTANIPSGPKPFLSKIVFYDRTPEQRFILRFDSRIPQYELWNDERNRVTEIKWRTDSKGNFEKLYTFRKNGAGIRNIAVMVDGDKGLGIARIAHDGINSFVMTSESKTDLLIKHNLAPARPPQLVKAGSNPPLVFANAPVGSQKLAAQPKGSDHQMRFVASEEPHDKDVKLVNIKVTAAPLDKVIRALAADAGRNLIMGGAVGGNVSASIQDMPYERALELILRSTAYRAEHLGNTTMIRSEMTDKNLKTYKIKYLDVSAVLPQIQAIASKDASIVVDANTNNIIINDRFQAHKNIAELIDTLDHPQRQVEVEAAIVQVDSRNNIQLGVNLSSATFAMGPNNDVTGRANSSFAIPTSGYFVGLSWNSVSGILSALQNRTHLNLLARPRVITLTDQEATMLLGSKIGYKTQVITNGVVSDTINFLTVGTQLKIKPHITANNDILMYIKPEVSDGFIDADTKAPTENTTTTETKVLAHNGQTIVIGGLLKDKVERTQNRMPIVGDLPIIGGLFGATGRDEQKNEIMILLSPNVLSDADKTPTELYEKSFRNFRDGGSETIVPTRILPAEEQASLNFSQGVNGVNTEAMK